MADRGYKKPKEIKEKQGTLRPCRENPNRAEYERGLTEPPKWLGKEAKQAYEDISLLLNQSEVATKADTPALSLLCNAYENYIKAAKDVQKTGQIIEQSMHSGEIKKIKNPSIDIMFEAHSKISGMLQQFGLTPASRDKVSKLTDKDNQDSSIQDLLN